MIVVKAVSRRVVSLMAALVLGLLAACTYTSELPPLAAQQEPEIPSNKRIPVNLVLVGKNSLSRARIVSESNGHGVDIRFGEVLLQHLEDRLADVFEDVSRAEEALPQEDDLTVVGLVDFSATETRQWVFDYKLELTIKDPRLKSVIGDYEETGTIHYSPPAGAVAAGLLQGASLYILTPVTAPAATQAIGKEAERLMEAALRSAVTGMRGQLLADGELRSYALSPTHGLLAEESSSRTRAPAPSALDWALDAVVVVYTGDSLGSGFFVSDDGYLVTNRHVAGLNETVTLIYRDGSKHEATVVDSDAYKDIALLKTKSPAPAVLTLSRGGDVAQGNDVMAVGAPRGLPWSISKGIVSAIRQTKYYRAIQTDAAINRGNSGGPLLDLTTKRVVGINTLTLRESQGLGFAVSSEEILFSFGSHLRGL